MNLFIFLFYSPDCNFYFYSYPVWNLLANYAVRNDDASIYLPTGEGKGG